MLFDCLDIENIVGFDWGQDNMHKIEEVFFNEPLLVVEDFKHSCIECRCVAFGKNDAKDFITVVFTIRDDKIRVISARVMNKKEKKVYERA